MKPVLLWSDILIFMLVIALVNFFYKLREDPQTRERWGQVFSSRLGMIAFTIIITYVGVALLDSLHFARRWTTPRAWRPKRCSTTTRSPACWMSCYRAWAIALSAPTRRPFALKSFEKQNMKTRRAIPFAISRCSSTPVPTCPIPRSRRLTCWPRAWSRCSGGC